MEIRAKRYHVVLDQRTRPALEKLRGMLGIHAGRNVSGAEAVELLLDISIDPLEFLLNTFPKREGKRKGGPGRPRKQMKIKTASDAAYSAGARAAMEQYSGQERVTIEDIKYWWEEEFDYTPGANMVGSWLQHHGAQHIRSKTGNYWVFPSINGDVNDESVDSDELFSNVDDEEFED